MPSIGLGLLDIYILNSTSRYVEHLVYAKKKISLTKNEIGMLKTYLYFCCTGASINYASIL